MSRLAYDVKETYLGTGSLSTYTFDFKIEDPTHLLVVAVDANGVKQAEVRGDDTTFLSSVTYNASEGGGSVTLANPLTSSWTLTLLLANDEPTQPNIFREKSSFTLKRFEMALDYITGPIQRLAYLITRAVRLDESTTGFDPKLPTTITRAGEDRFLKIKDDGTGFEVGVAGAGGAGGVIPDGGQEFDLLEHSGSEGEPRWTLPLVYQGYSERFSQLVNLSGIKAVTDYIMDMGYAPPTVSLATSPNYATLRERGDTISSVDLIASINKVLDDIAEVRFYRGGTLIDTQTSGGGIPDGGTNNYTDSDAFSTNRSYSVQVDDTSAQSKPSATSSRTFSFVYPYYYGVGEAGLGAGVSALTKQIINETTNTTRNFTVDGTEKMYFAYPASYGTLSSILDINSFNTVGDWTLTVANITGLDGNPVSYNIYEFNNYAVAGTYQYTFQQ